MYLVGIKPTTGNLCIHYVTQVTHLLVLDCKIGDFKIAGCVCLQKKFVYFLSCEVFFGDF